MKQPPRERPIKDERDDEIEVHAKSYALEWMTAATQILTVICLVKGNPAWKGTLSLLFFAIALALLFQYREYQEAPFKKVGIFFLLCGVALLLWFGFTG